MQRWVRYELITSVTLLPSSINNGSNNTMA